MNLSLKPAGRQDMKKIKRLYLAAFPPEERAPFGFIRRRAGKRADMLAAFDKGEFIGFAYTVTHEDMAYLFYFAICEDKRGMGYGSAILERLIEIYSGKRFFLAREQLDSSAENYTQRINRHSFYLHNGLIDLPGHITEAGVIYDVMGIGGEVSPADYDGLITPWAGKFIKKRADMRLFID